MNIIIANQKGGVGKTTLSILLANYLTIVKNEEALVIDMDDQRSFYGKWVKEGKEHDEGVYNEILNLLSDFPQIVKENTLPIDAENKLNTLIENLTEQVKNTPELRVFLDNAIAYTWENKQYYEVLSKDLSEYGSIRKTLKAAKDAFVIMDLPGKMDDDHLIPIYEDADLVICPTRYDELTITSTFHFVQTLRMINADVPIIFIPNMVKSTVKYELKSQIKEKLSLFGKVEADLPDRAMLQRLTSFDIPNDLKDLLSSLCDNMYNDFLRK